MGTRIARWNPWQNIADACVHCGKCRENCAFLDKYEMDLGDVTKLQEHVYGCFLCGNCDRVCPAGISGRQLFQNLRRMQVRDGKLEKKPYSFVLKEKKDYNSGITEMPRRGGCCSRAATSLRCFRRPTGKSRTCARPRHRNGVRLLRKAHCGAGALPGRGANREPNQPGTGESGHRRGDYHLPELLLFLKGTNSSTSEIHLRGASGVGPGDFRAEGYRDSDSVPGPNRSGMVRRHLQTVGI